MQLCSVEHKLKGLDSPLIKTLERENLILMKKMLKKCSTCVQLAFNLCSTEQSCINIGITCYKISTLGKLTLF